MELPNRKSPRLSGFDYATHACYFITICTHKKQNLFGNPYDLNAFGKIAEHDLLQISMHFPGVAIEKYVIMPNHIHALISLGLSETERSRPFPTLSAIVGLYKSGVSKSIHRFSPDLAIWQKSFYDHIIRGKKDYDEIWTYIDNNPKQWELDEFYIQ